ncbi:hypothetical protein HPB47_018877 [Ixodes persulcatus]|uniref:Uncharacterized protein n=1 Tax=Ixodes persulcatus TaxID=34615 RepID=A0AC60QJL7_IXOPE|nr:hypothetical protein HPB47_018877 [Ixodes persulcatus]
MPVWYSTCTAIKQIGTFQLIDTNDQALLIVTVEEQHRPVVSGFVTSTSATAIKAPLHQFVFIGHGETDRSMFAKSSLFFVQVTILVLHLRKCLLKYWAAKMPYALKLLILKHNLKKLIAWSCMFSKRRLLWETAKANKTAGERVSLVNDKLWVNNEFYVWDELTNEQLKLPSFIQLERVE